jgi:hypothetical protein
MDQDIVSSLILGLSTCRLLPLYNQIFFFEISAKESAQITYPASHHRFSDVYMA